MIRPSLFLKDIHKGDYLDDLSIEERSVVERYLEDMRGGPGDKAIDIEWQETCRGYYAHLEHIYMLSDSAERARYREHLLEDIEAWLQKSPGNYMVEVVRDRVFGDG